MIQQQLYLETSPQESLTLYDLQRMVRTTLEDRFSAPLWISAEISELKVNRSGHCYLNLVEKGNNDGTPRAEARAVIWRSSYNQIANLFSSATGSALTAGIRILIRVVVTYHEVYGFSLQIIDIDPSYTLGEVERRRRETIARLEADGVWDMNHELTLPRPTLRIAVVSSGTAAGYRDFIKEISRSPYRFQITLFESLMQGEYAEQSILNSLSAIANKEELFDVVAIIRGGGSTSDLSLFDSYHISSYVAQFPLPVITGIGHDKDISVTDMVAHTMCKTPTAVATLLSEGIDNEMAAIANIATDIFTLVTNKLHNENLHTFQYLAELKRLTSERVQAELSMVNNIDTAISTLVELRLRTEQQHLNEAERLIDTYSVDNILKLGFAVMRGSEGVIASTKNANIGDNINIELIDGELNAEIKSINKKTI
jgi:exodeoxyribonuclease VII large subunit